MSFFRNNISISGTNNGPRKKKFPNKYLAILLSITILASMISGSITVLAADNVTDKPGYSYVTFESASTKGESFLACGSNGRLDRIYSDNTVENIPTGTDKDLSQVLIQPEITVICGRSGTILYTLDGKSILQCVKVTGSDINGLARFGGMFYACASDGNILSSIDGISWAVNIKLSDKPILSISSAGIYCMAITADTDIHITEDGKKWQLQNFNDHYNGYYDKFEFTNLSSIGVSFIILGFPVETPDYPTMMFSDSGGEVWLFRTLGLINDEYPEEYLPLRINSVCASGEDIIGACSGGRILNMPSCTKCNTLWNVANVELRSIADGITTIVVVGDDYYYSFNNDLNPAAELDDGDYSDITDPGVWYYEAAYYVTEYGLMQGTGVNVFSPGASLTRAMFVTITGRLAEKRGETTTGFSNNFTDVQNGSWYSQYVAWAADKAIVNGYSATEFGPNDPVTREQMAALMIRFCDYMKIKPDSNIGINFLDAGDISDWAVDPVNRIAAAGLMQGADGMFKPRASSTRAEVAQLFMNFVMNYWY